MMVLFSSQRPSSERQGFTMDEPSLITQRQEPLALFLHIYAQSGVADSAQMHVSGLGEGAGASGDRENMQTLHRNLAPRGAKASPPRGPITGRSQGLLE